LNERRDRRRKEKWRMKKFPLRYKSSIRERDNTDIVVNEIDERLDKCFAVSVFGAHKVLYGNGHCLEKYFSEIDPTFEEAWAEFENAKDIFKLGLKTEEELRQERLFRNAFNGLFHASRLAAMTYLSTEEGRWEIIKRSLPKAYRDEFEKYINTLHVEYFYRGNFPEENVEKEFEKWTQKVEKFISKLKKNRT